jgi:glycine/D-amino acid oxidase-like deaminating enzyme
MEKGPSMKTIMEPASEVKVIREADVVVVGGGPGGHAAAVSAARNGADTVLIERYGHLGGMATGGLVIMIPHLSDGTNRMVLKGQCKEWLDRLDKSGAVAHQRYEDVGSVDKDIVEYWNDFHQFFVVEGRVQLAAMVDPELLKCALNDMVEEAGVKLFLHSWGTRTITEGNEAKGVIFESKSGRQAILADVVIDGTGDGDLLPSAGAEFDRTINPNLRISTAAVVFRLGNVDTKKHQAFRKSDPRGYGELMNQLVKGGGFPVAQRSAHEDVLWVSNWIPGLDILNVEDLTRAEVEIRKKMIFTHDYFKKNIPGFERSFILDTASQTGTRGARRVMGEYMVTEKDWRAGTTYDDTIAVIPQQRHVISDEFPHFHVPFRTLVPKKVDSLLVAGRSFSSDDVANNEYNLIPHCTLYGMAAGTAAALSIKAGVKVRNVDIKALKASLIKQDVVLPETLDMSVKPLPAAGAAKIATPEAH